MSQDSEFEAFIEEISPDVLGVLEKQQFFTKLEEVVFPNGDGAKMLCRHDFSASAQILTALGHDQDALNDIFDVMRSRGGFCDCEIIWNAAPQSNVREKYWKRKAPKL